MEKKQCSSQAIEERIILPKGNLWKNIFLSCFTKDVYLRVSGGAVLNKKNVLILNTLLTRNTKFTLK